MEARTHIDFGSAGRVAAKPAAPRRRTRPGQWVAAGLGAGLAGGLAMAAPLVIWDWVRSGHRALELPMAATAWLFGLGHFSHAHDHVWSIAIGIALFLGYWLVSGLAFSRLAGRVFGVASAPGGLAAGFAWGFVNFTFFWYMLLPTARDGAPFRATAAAPGLFVAPSWVWILAFTVLGLVMGAFYAALRPPAGARGEETERRDDHSKLGRAA